MYKLVFLLVFSATALMALEPEIHVMVNIYFKREPTGASIQFGINPAGTIQVSDGQEIQFHAQTTTALYNFWCNNANGETILHPTITFVSYDREIQTWTLGGPIIYSKTVINNKLYCVSRIKEPDGIKVNAQRGMEDGQEYIQGEFELEFQITETVQANPPRQTRNNVMQSPKENLSQPPNSGSGVSLTIPQLGNEWTWINEHQSRKKYKYKFVEGETRFDCSLNNPTNNEEEYAISCYLNGTSNSAVWNHKPVKISDTTAIIQPKRNHILACDVTLNKYDKSILCSAVNKKPSGITSLQNEIDLEYIPAPSIFLYITEETKKKILGKYPPEIYKQEYHYHFKAGEEVRIKCEVNTTEGYEKYKDHYGVTLQIDSKERYSEQEPFVLRTLKLEKDDKVLRCSSWNKKGSNIPGAPGNLQSIVYLYPEPSENTAIADPLELTIGWLKNLQKGEFYSVNRTQMYNYYFTDDDFITVSCNANGNKKRSYDLALHLDGNQVKQLKGVTYIDYTFYPKENNKYISCVALDRATERTLETHVIQLQYRSPDLVIKGLENLQKGSFFAENSTQMYDYQFTDGDIIKLPCYSTTAKTYNLAFYLDTKLKAEDLDIWQRKVVEFKECKPLQENKSLTQYYEKFYK